MVGGKHAPQGKSSRRQLPLSCPATLLKVVAVLVPTARIAVRQTITINASMMAYSTAVGPSSETTNLRIFAVSRFMVFSSFSTSLANSSS